MKDIKVIFAASCILMMGLALCACSKEKESVGNTLNNVDMSAARQRFLANKNDDSDINNGDAPALPVLGRGERTDKEEGAVPENATESKATKNKVSGTMDEGETAKDDDSPLTGGSTGGSTSGKTGGSTGKNDKDKDKDKENNDEEEIAQENVRELEEAVEEKYLNFFPIITERIQAISTTDYGATVVFSAVQGERFDKYVEAVIAKGFLLSSRTTTAVYMANDKKGMFVKIEVMNGFTNLSVYSSDKHFD